MIRLPRVIRRPLAAATGDWPEHIHPVLRRVYTARGVHSHRDAALSLKGLLTPDALGGIETALDLLIRAIETQASIVVVGDFDADGATGTAVAVRGLRMLGADNVGFRVPHRMRHGYGLSPALVADLLPGRPALLLTVDSGIACEAGVRAARQAGMRVIVTDHHLPGPSLPSADAIVNPNVPGDAFASKALAGVGVVFYLLLALRRRLRMEGRFTDRPEPDLSSLLDLVALGTIADLVPLDDNNRTLVAAGLRRIRVGQCQPGVRALAEVSGRALETLATGDFSFALGPRLNAAGRLDDMRIGINCLLTDDIGEARRLAAVLHQINGERRELQQQMLDEAELLIKPLLNNATDAAGAITVFDPNWHPGVIGLVASRLKDRLHRPVVAFAPGSDSEYLRGSARSIPGLHIRDVLAAIAATRPELIERFGGHAMAAGLSLRRDRLDDFRMAFAQTVAGRLDPNDREAILLSDGPLRAGEFTFDLASQIRLGGPWGQGFPEPLFDNRFTVERWRIVGERHLKLTLAVDGQCVEAIHFGGWNGTPPAPAIEAVYTLEPDEFRGGGNVQLLIRHRVAAV